jgi:hypothetical protein
MVLRIEVLLETITFSCATAVDTGCIISSFLYILESYISLVVGAITMLGRLVEGVGLIETVCTDSTDVITALLTAEERAVSNGVVNILVCEGCSEGFWRLLGSDEDTSGCSKGVSTGKGVALIGLGLSVSNEVGVGSRLLVAWKFKGDCIGDEYEYVVGLLDGFFEVL